MDCSACEVEAAIQQGKFIQKGVQMAARHTCGDRPEDEWIIERLAAYKACRSHREVEAIKSMLVQSEVDLRAQMAARDAAGKTLYWALHELRNAEGHDQKCRIVELGGCDCGVAEIRAELRQAASRVLASAPAAWKVKP